MNVFNKRRTLKRSIISVLVVTVLPIVICMFILSLISLNTIRKQIYSTSYDQLSLHVSQVDKELNAMSKYLLGIDYNEAYISMFEKNNIEDNYFASAKYMEMITPMIYMLEYVEGILIYSPVSEASVYHFNSDLHKIDFIKRENIINYIKQNASEMKKNKWAQYKVEDNFVLIYVYKLRNTYFCSWISLENLINVADEWKIADNGIIYLLNDNNEVMAQTGASSEIIDLSGDISSYYFTDNNYLVLGVPSKVGEFKLMEAVNIKSLTNIYERIFYIIVGILIIFFLLVPFVLHTLNLNIFTPMGKLQKAISAVEQGNFDYQITESKDTEEFEHLISAFNSMIQQIEHLKIETYEDKIEQHRIMLQYLQVQIEPHFYLNALNTINAMAQVGDTDLILQLTKNLSEYMRFITKSKNNTVSIKDEIQHIMNYIEIIKIRLGSEFELKIDIDQEIMSFLIPPLVIQSLVENIIKYAFDVYDKNEIVIRGKVYEKKFNKGIWLCVEDNGAGYPADVIQSFYKGNDDPTRIGLENTKKRLNYMFGDNAIFKIRNKPDGGAKAEIFILEQS